MGKRLPSTKNRDFHFLNEVDSLCPLCGKRLMSEKNGAIIKLFDKAHIYPHSITAEQKEALKDITPPENIESIDNIIALCKNCHKEYDSHTTQEDYLKLYEIKQTRSANYKAKLELSDIQIESEINNVLEKLKTIGVQELVELHLNALSIKEKIEAGALQTKVLSLVTQYYPYLKTQFQNMDRENTNKFNLIATTIKLAFQKAQSQSLLKEDIFEQLANWLKSKTSGTKTSCEIIISYFVQNCEVFDAIS